MESTPEQAAEGKAVVTVLAAVLERLVKSNTQSTNPNGASPEITKFHALKAPGISIKQYLERVSFFYSFYTRSQSPPSVLISFVFISLVISKTLDSQICILFHRMLRACSNLH